MKYYGYDLVYTGNSFQETELNEITKKEFDRQKNNKGTRYDSEEKAYCFHSNKEGTRISYVCERSI